MHPWKCRHILNSGINRLSLVRIQNRAGAGGLSQPAPMKPGHLVSGLPCLSRRHLFSVLRQFILPPDFALYSKVSAEVMTILRSFGFRFQQVSIDEAFLDLSPLGSFRDASSLAEQIQDNYQDETGPDLFDWYWSRASWLPRSHLILKNLPG